MKRIAILTSGDAPVGTEMARVLNQGSRYRVGVVPPSLAVAEFDILSDALRKENVKMLILENYSRELPEGFPFEIMEIVPGEDAGAAITRLSERESAEEQERGTIPPPPPRPENIIYEREPKERCYNGSLGPQREQYVQTEEPAKREPMPPTYLVWSIVSTLLCCFIPGVVAIVFSAMVSSRYFSGDTEGARRASRMAEIWIILSIVLGIVSLTLYIPMMMIAG